jgi:hypothetical protein
MDPSSAGTSSHQISFRAFYQRAGVCFWGLVANRDASASQPRRLDIERLLSSQRLEPRTVQNAEGSISGWVGVCFDAALARASPPTSHSQHISRRCILPIFTLSLELVAQRRLFIGDGAGKSDAAAFFYSLGSLPYLPHGLLSPTASVKHTAALVLFLRWMCTECAMLLWFNSRRWGLKNDESSLYGLCYQAASWWVEIL